MVALIFERSSSAIAASRFAFSAFMSSIDSRRNGSNAPSPDPRVTGPDGFLSAALSATLVSGAPLPSGEFPEDGRTTERPLSGGVGPGPEGAPPTLLLVAGDGRSYEVSSQACVS